MKCISICVLVCLFSFVVSNNYEKDFYTGFVQGFFGKEMDLNLTDYCFGQKFDDNLEQFLNYTKNGRVAAMTTSALVLGISIYNCENFTDVKEKIEEINFGNLFFKLLGEVPIELIELFTEEYNNEDSNAKSIGNKFGKGIAFLKKYSKETSE